MKVKDCRVENLLSAQRQGRLSEEERSHLQTCESCRDALAVDRLLRRDAVELRETSLPPSPDLIWEMARRRSRIDRVEKATWSITLTQRLTVGCIAATSAWAVFRGWPAISKWLMAYGEVLNPASISTLMAGGSLLIAAFGVGLLLMLDGLHWSWSRSGF